MHSKSSNYDLFEAAKLYRFHPPTSPHNVQSKPPVPTLFRLSAPQDVEPSEPSLGFSWWLNILIGNVNKRLDRDIFQSNNLRLAYEFVRKVEYQEQGDIDIRGDERFVVPMSLNKSCIASCDEEKAKKDKRCP